MYPGHWAQLKPDNKAIINTASGSSISWRQLNDRSNQIAQLLHGRGLASGDHIALLMENHLDYLVIGWAAFRSGLYITCINRYLTAEETAYIINDSGAQALFTTTELAIHEQLTTMMPDCIHRFCREPAEGYEHYPPLLEQCPTQPLSEEPCGDSMLYSSGTTGRPKGIKRPLNGRDVSEGIPGVERANPYGIDEHTHYLSPAPLYHAAPFGYCMRTLALGGSVFMMERFDAAEALACIEKYTITHSQWVPTMFVRMLKLPKEIRRRYNLSSHQVAIHAAAPCPVEVKHQMMDWWGPILWEYYAGTERSGSTVISPPDWLAHPGSVGRASSGTLHICDEEGKELPAGESGLIYFEQPQRPFEYHNAPDKTSSATHPDHANWTSLGDVGYVDEEGFLYLTDRKSFMIISGGVNIYPREIEDALILHDKVQDVAVFGIPHEEFGEQVKAVVEPVRGVNADQGLADELTAFAREKLAAYKVPRSIDFTAELPRLPTGKLYKRGLQESYL